MIAKVLANRLKVVLGNITSLEKNGFVLGREITDCIMLISEVAHSLKMNHKASMIIKLDMCKAYDKVVLYFLLKVMERMGFNSH